MEFEEVVGWGGQDWEQDVTGVALDAEDKVYVLRRGADAVTVLSPEGIVLHRWGSDCFSSRPHLISIGGDTIYIADDGAHQVFAFDLSGRLLEVIGSGVPSNTGYNSAAPSAEFAFEQMAGGPPFNRPTKAAPASNGELFVSDGYRNCRIHRFSADRLEICSWGGPGAEPGCFVIPHSIVINDTGQLLVCDRENDRVQIFSREGQLLETWTDVQRPTDLAFDRSGRVYMTELPRGPKDIKSWRLGRAVEELPGRVTIRAPDGAIIALLKCPGVEFLAPHAIAVDSTGAVYVSEVQESFANYTGRALRKHRCLRKFIPR
jgi:sugar lactone lactonase YvrE